MSTVAPEILAKITRLYDESTFMRELGVVLGTVGAGEVHTSLAVGPSQGQQDGFVHAGVTTAIADHGAGCAAATLAPIQARVLTQTFTMNLLRPAVGPVLRCRSAVLRIGRTSAVVESEVFAQERLVAKGVFTIAIIG